MWLRHQTDGDLDDNKLVDGLTGEMAIYKRRGQADPTQVLFACNIGGSEPSKLLSLCALFAAVVFGEQHGVQVKPKRFVFLLDASGSMYRFNGHDQRLQRMLEAACMIMEAFDGLDRTKFEYSLIAHSGESPEVVMVKPGQPPKNDHERLKILQQLHAHSQVI